MAAAPVGAYRYFRQRREAGAGNTRFISDARRVRPELPIFVVSEWGADLPLALQSLEAFAPAAEVY